MNAELPAGLQLTELRRSDIETLVEHLNDRGIYDVTLRIPSPYAAQDAENWLDLIDQMTAKSGQRTHWAIRDAEDRLIGSVGLEGIGVQPAHRAELGYWLARPYWNRGFTTAVVRDVCRRAFDEFGFVKVSAHVFAFNGASARVLEKCGFEREGYLKRHCVKDGRPIDVVAYGLLKPE